MDEAVAWIQQQRARNPHQPFFLNLWFHEPHAPLAAPDDIVTRHGDPDDPAQQRNLAHEQPAVLERLKRQLLAINESVMADAADWHEP